MPRRQEIITSAVNIGISEIIKLHPRFTKAEHYIARHINLRSLNEKFNQLYYSARTNGINRIATYITNGLASYVASGRAFDNAGKETILRKGLEAKASSGFFKGMSARRELAGDKYLDQVIGAWSEINAVAKAGRHELPEDFAKPMKYLSRLGFAIPAVEVLRETGLINQSAYSQLRNNIRKGAYESHQEAIGKLAEYSTYQKIAAAVFAVFGFAVLLFNSGITGAVVGASKFTGALVGAISIIIACVLLLISKKNI